MNRAELLTAAGSVKELVEYIEAGATAIQIGCEQFAMRLPGSIPASALTDAANQAHGAGARLYVTINRIIDNATLALLPAYLEAVLHAGVDAVIFGDPAVMMTAQELNLDTPNFHWNPEMTATNYKAVNYWAGKGVTRAVLARELTLDQVLECKRQSNAEIQIQVHGTTNIFHSRRHLIDSYRKHLNRSASDVQSGYSSANERLFLIEEERQQERYPVYEDESGTHIMSGDDICMLDRLDELLQAEIDSLKVESLLKPVTYNKTVLQIYRQAMDCYYAEPEAYSFREEWLQRLMKAGADNDR